MRGLILAALMALGAGAATAQVATLAADSVQINPDGTIVAEGDVEILFEETRLLASRVTYSADGERLLIEGPIYLTGPDETVLIADAADLDQSLREGIIRGARLVLNQQVQLAANRIDRVGGRYTQLTKVVASSCTVCKDRPTPVWEIRASRVVRDEDALQLYFTDAQLRIGGVPVFYMPRLRLPDPSLDRAAGFLVPEIENSSRLGTGIKAPYFLPLGRHADVTLTPYVSTSTATLQMMFRQELSFGSYQARGAVSADDLEDSTRAFLFAEGVFRLPRDYQLRFDFELVSDEAYLLDYGYSDKDRLDSAITLERAREKDDFSASVTSFRTLRAGEVSTTRELPNELLETRYTRRIYRSARLGEVWMGVDAMSLQRPSATPSEGRDVSRVGVSLDWDNRWPLVNGMVLSADAGLAVDQYVVGQDPAFGSTSTQSAQKAALTLRWPMARRDGGGVRQLLEPLVQLSWTNVTGDAVPNEDSTVTEFDEGNLLAFSRFPGIDRYEEGLRANLGLSWTRVDPAGWSLNGTVGRIVRFDDTDQFPETSGLSGDISDWMVGLGLSLGERLSVETRSVFDDGLTFSLSETRIGWQRDGNSLVGTYLWRDDVGADDVSELTLESAYRFAPNWTGRFDWRYEADASRTTGAGLGLMYENECIGVDLSVSRRFTSSTSVEPATEFALRVSLTGFGTGSSPGVQARSCSG